MNNTLSLDNTEEKDLKDKKEAKDEHKHQFKRSTLEMLEQTLQLA